MLCTFASSSNSEANFVVTDKLLYCFIMSIEALNIPVQARLGLTPKWSFAMYPAGCTQQAEQQSELAQSLNIDIHWWLDTVQNIMDQKS